MQTVRMKARWVTACAILMAAATAVGADDAQRILHAAGVKGGLVVHVGCGEGELTAALHANDSLLVQGLDTDAKAVDQARGHIQSLGLYGKVSVDVFDGRSLPYTHHLVNLVVADDLGAVAMSEVMRVLAPEGVAYIRQGDKWTKEVKPRPDDIDEWTHYLHEAGGNAVADDELVGPPVGIQWKAGPRFARHHDLLASVSTMVSAGGRVFYIVDEAPVSLMQFPPNWQLVARDAFNGMLLWKRPIPSWANYLRPFRSGPPQLPRRLVAVGDEVYVTLGAEAPVTKLDAASGAILKTYEDTEGTDEIICHNGILLLVVFDAKAPQASDEPEYPGIRPAKSPRNLMAVRAETGEVLWQKSGGETASLRPITLAADGGHVVYQCSEEVRCADLQTGRVLWRYSPSADESGQQPDPASKTAGKGAKKPRKKPGPWLQSYYAPTLVVDEDHGVVLWAYRGQLTAISLDKGRSLWSCGCTPDFRAPADVFIADGLVWAGLFATEGRDSQTGRVNRTIDIEGLLTAGHHPRCYRNKATNRFVISNKRGMEFFDLASGEHSRNNWVRGGCQYGIMPANGLTYIPANACCCYAGVQLHGFYALSADRDGESATGIESATDRLERGGAYRDTSLRRPAEEAGSGSWPTFRGSETRGGSAPGPAPTAIKTIWERRPGPKLSAPVVAGGRLMAAAVEQGRILAFDAGNGRRLWSFAAGGRVDSPPTIWRDLVLFGSADGNVYCLRAADGELVWRFRAAPTRRLIVADGQLESVWPVPGSVLVKDGVAYFVAGRSCYLDGGIRLYALDATTGRKFHEARVSIEHGQDNSRAFVMAGVRPDILVTDGKYIYLQQLKFDKQLVRQTGAGRHLMCHSGLADDAWFYRTFWRLGHGDAWDFPNSYIKHALRVPFGQLLVFDDKVVCGLQTFISPDIRASEAVAGSRGCMLFGDENAPFSPDAGTDPDSDYPPGKMTRPKQPVAHKWTTRLAFQARAMVLVGKTLFVAGWPDVVDAADPYAAIDGRKPGVLWALSAEDGSRFSVRQLESAPVFDGMIAAGGRLYISTLDGRLLCMGNDK